MVSWSLVELAARLKAALGAAEQGDFRSARALQTELADPAVETWALAFDCQRWLAGFEAISLPQAFSLVERGQAGLAEQGLLEARRLRGLAAALCFDVEALNQLEATASDVNVSAWRKLAAGADGRIAAELAAAERTAASQKRASLVLEAASLLALVHAELGDLEEALAVARRASRMARTEGLPIQEYLANLVLARTRRLDGHPHLALRILSALANFATPPFRPWLEWETIMAGGDLGANAQTHSPARELQRALAAARGGSCQDFETATRELVAAAASWAPLESDVRRLSRGLGRPLGVEPTDATEAALQDWCAGSGAAPPFGLHSLNAADAVGDTARVAVWPDGRCLRFLSVGAALLSQSGELQWLAPTLRHHGRTDTMLAVLALAGPEGIDDGELFQRVYGFAFSRNSHHEVLTLLIHRTRERLGGLGRIDRAEGRTALTVSEPLMLSDPRCRRPVDERVLRFLARQHQATARDAAEALGMPLRRIQESLRQLAEQGACEPHKKGRQLVYGLEDTTFQEPTSHR